ncbi:oxygen-dependent protoporphyrinogen oxidase [Ascoidea rubescens DSM 1968]|uniref:Protoporphyrinogen oxidase n=1 Tax=Ascoidea rubescens DSM 1968 TaxID=1344418 RepID=A0A1D2VSH9_9ASCO|nr:Protoporphyrinogen oxidase [Ascoidea rubescens DSM 1968]ODV64561.1 Protoporphyrinogen oxidase [Ascoidea rubescens DSM 1968]
MKASLLLFKALAKNENIAVVGGGISGLSYAYFLTKLRPDLTVTVFEESNKTGGYIYSPIGYKKELPLKHNLNGAVEENFEKILFEKGPRTLRGKSDGTLIILDLLHRFKLTDQVYAIPKDSIANKKYLLSNGNKLIEVPNSFLRNPIVLLKFLMSPVFQFRKAMVNLICEVFRRKKGWSDSKMDESVESFLNRRLGKELSNIASAVYHGIFAGDIGKLSIKSLMPGMYQIEKHGNSLVGITLLNTKRNLLSIFISEQEKRVAKQKRNDNLLSKDIKKYEKFFFNKDLNLSKLSVLLKSIPMISFKNGLQSLTTALGENFSLSNSGKNRILTENGITQIDISEERNKIIVNNQYEFDYLKSTLNSPKLVKILENSTENLEKNGKIRNLIELMKRINYVTVCVGNIYVPRQDLLKSNHGFGYLIPKNYEKQTNNKEKLLGVIFDSDIEKSRKLLFNEQISRKLTNEELPNKDKIDKSANNKLFYTDVKFPELELDFNKEQLDYTKITAIMGGHYWSPSSNNQDVDKYDNEENVPSKSIALKMIKLAVSKQLNIELDDIKEKLIELEIVKNAIPQYEVGFIELREEIHQKVCEIYKDKVKLGGMSFSNGIGVPDCVLNGFTEALADSGIEEKEEPDK